MKNFRKSSKPASAILLNISVIIFIMTAFFYGCSSESSKNDKEAGITEKKALEEPFTTVDEMPVYSGGDAALLKFVAENTVYPETAKANGITGKVVVRFVVETDGSVTSPELIKGADTLLNAEALRVVNSLPRFEKPGKQGGKPVRVYYAMPITFALK